MKKRLEAWIGKTADTLLRNWDRGHAAQLRDDLIQEGWATALMAERSYNPTGGSTKQSWIISQVKRDMVRYLRKEQMHGAEHDDIDELLEDESVEQLIDFEAEQRLSEQYMLHDLVSKLPERERNVAEMYYFDDMSLSEIGQVLGITKQSVHEIVNRFVVKIQQDVA